MTTTNTDTPRFVTRWLETLPEVTIEQIAPDPKLTGVFCTDMINAFLREGALSSPRVDKLAEPVTELMRKAWDHGVRMFTFTQDTHDENTPEFQAYPPHAIAGTSESQMIDELAELPFSKDFKVIEKDSLHPAIDTEFDEWWDQHSDIQTAIVAGNCTDLCVYQLAMHLTMRANALGRQEFSVIVPANVVNTFDIPESEDAEPGTAHPGDFFHNVFLYHMASNGVRIVKRIT